MSREPDAAPAAVRPTLVVYEVATADGRVALSPDVLLMGDSRWPRVENGGYAAVLNRHHPDALLEGSGTLVLPDAGPVEWPEDDLRTPSGDSGDEAGHFLPEDVLAQTVRWFAVVDSRGRVVWPFTQFPYPEWAGTHLLVLVSRATPPGYLAYLRRERIPYLVAGEGRVDLSEALATMRAVLGVATVVATCGAQLGGTLLRLGLIDTLEIEVLPIAAGGNRAPMMLTSADLGPGEAPTSLRLNDATVYADGRVLLSYAVNPRE